MINSNANSAASPQISEADFVNVWGARTAPSGDLFQYHDVTNLPLNTVWTVVEGENEDWIALPGFHVVNKMGYVVTDKSWDDDTIDAMWFEAFERDEDEVDQDA